MPEYNQYLVDLNKKVDALKDQATSLVKDVVEIKKSQLDYLKHTGENSIDGHTVSILVSQCIHLQGTILREFEVLASELKNLCKVGDS